MEIQSRIHKGLDALALLLHIRHADTELKAPAAETAGVMDEEPEEVIEPEDDWDDDEDE